jgi:CMP-N,N'-diacetyllegionaminic acid synthase
VIALVPARGGSKGLPGKNVRPLAGKPLIVHTLDCARQARGIERVVVSTDDDAIAAAARTVPGVEVPFRRPAELATDAASALDVIFHAADWLAANEGARPAAITVLLPTAPLRRPDDVEACLALFARHGAAVALSVVAAKPAAWQQAMGADGRLGPVPGLPSSIDNRQELGRVVIPNGAVYVLELAALARTRSYFGARTYGHEMPADRSIDIDTEADFRIADALMRRAA